MKHLKSLLYWLLDNALAWFTPSWRRNGRETIAALTRYTNYNRHTLTGETLELCDSQKSKLEAALLRWDKEECVRLVKQVEIQGEAMPGYKRGAVVEMVESFMVIMVIFLGLRTYYVQPFRIPTGSMQPSLNGIIVHPVNEVPGLAGQAWDMLTLGSSYVEATADTTKSIINIEDHPKYLLFTETTLTFSDGSKVNIPSAKGAVMQYLKEQGKFIETPNGIRLGTYRPGETIIRARVDAGDMILVNRVAYHFRAPQRGETFVFDTRGINTSMQAPSAVRMSDQQSGTHYIKRLCGLPGDTLQVAEPFLLVNGQAAAEPTIARVAAGKAPFNPEGYQTINHRNQPLAYMTDLGPVHLQNTANPAMREYAALGDNTTNSLDSRYWGPVRQFNIIGPASFTLWPFTSHWGCIE
ncbi:MAG: signal peptidase I [Akkermansia sp.]|nr:signal peptidase I [Akkermansia sp.]MBR2313735.1 signal peptidase I [Akkermansia sp.]